MEAKTTFVFFMGEPVVGVLAQEVESAGDGCRTGETRTKIMGPREIVRLKLLTLALEQYPDQSWRPVWSLPQRDKLTSAWTLCLPHPDTTMSPAEFTECMAAHLCLHSIVCVSRLGETLPGRKKVDRYGDMVMSANLPGSGHKTRHDKMKIHLLKLMKWAGMNVQCEVFGLFSRDIPQAGLARMERGRKRQGIIPDFKLLGGGGGGGGGRPGESDATLADLKFITGIELRYPRNPAPQQEPRKAVNRRACLVNTEYIRHAVSLDVKYCGVPRARRGQTQIVGPVQSRLSRYGEVEGWCFGIWGEGSDTVHTLIHNIVESRLQVLGQQPGRQGKVRSLEGERAHLVGSVRRQVSFLAVRANARLILGRVESHIGQGTSEAGKRRQYAAGVERIQARMRRAQALSLSQGRNILRRGCFRMD